MNSTKIIISCILVLQPFGFDGHSGDLEKRPRCTGRAEGTGLLGKRWGGEHMALRGLLAGARAVPQLGLARLSPAGFAEGAARARLCSAPHWGVA